MTGETPEGAQNGQICDHAGLVVRGATSVDRPSRSAPRTVRYAICPGACWLYVVVGIEQNQRSAIRSGDVRRTVGTPLELGINSGIGTGRAQQFRAGFCATDHVRQVLPGKLMEGWRPVPRDRGGPRA